MAQAPLAQELKKLFTTEAFGTGRKAEEFRDDAKRFFVNYFRQVSVVLGAAWNGRKHSIKSPAALRAFIRVAPDIVQRLDQQHADRADFRAIGRVIAPWGRRIGDLRFETDGAWKRSGSTVDQLAKELKLALQYPEGRWPRAIGRWCIRLSRYRRSGYRVIGSRLSEGQAAPGRRVILAFHREGSTRQLPARLWR